MSHPFRSFGDDLFSLVVLIRGSMDALRPVVVVEPEGSSAWFAAAFAQAVVDAMTQVTASKKGHGADHGARIAREDTTHFGGQPGST